MFIHIIRTILLLAVLILFGWIGNVFFVSFALPESQYDFSDTHNMRIYPQRPITQIFSTDLSQINGVDIAFSNAGAVADNTLILTLKDRHCVQTLIKMPVNFSQKTLQPGRFRSIRFPEKISITDNTVYCMELFYDIPSVEDNDMLPKVKTSKNSYDNRYKLINSGSRNGYEKRARLVMRLTYSDGTWSDLSHLSHRITQYKPLWMKNVIIPFLAFGTIIFTFLTFITLLFLATKHTKL